MERTTEYQICVLSKTANDETVVTHTENVFADTIAGAMEQAAMKGYNLEDVRVYPYCTPTDGESQLALAKYTLASVENWERRKNRYVLDPQERTNWDREDMIMAACIAILAVFEKDPHANMHELKTTAFATIRAEKERFARISSHEFTPSWAQNWIVCNVVPRYPRSNCPQLDELIRKAVDTADMTSGQMRVLLMSYRDEKTAYEIAVTLGIQRATVYQSLYRAYYKVLSRALEIDPDMSAFTAAGYTVEDIAETLATLRRRARWNRKK